jgi:hypothetical protein
MILRDGPFGRLSEQSNSDWECQRADGRICLMAAEREPYSQLRWLTILQEHRAVSFDHLVGNGQ